MTTHKDTLPSETRSQHELILNWMDSKRPVGGECPVLLSDMKRELGDAFDETAFDDLVRCGTIVAEFPEAKPGDSGRQFWNFAFWTLADPKAAQ